MDRTCEVLSCSIVSCQIVRKVGTSFFVEEKAGVFTTNLSMSKFLSAFNERNYILPKNLQLRLFFTNLFSERRQLCHHFSGVYVSPCLCCTNIEGDSYQVSDVQNKALNFECLRNRRWRRIFSLFPR